MESLLYLYLSIYYLEFFCKENLSLLPHLFIGSHICINTDSVYIYTLGFNSILLYLFVTQIVSAVAIWGLFK